MIGTTFLYVEGLLLRRLQSKNVKWLEYFFVLDAVEYLGSLLSQLKLVLDCFTLIFFFNHDKRDSLSVDIILDHFQKIKFIKCVKGLKRFLSFCFVLNVNFI